MRKFLIVIIGPTGVGKTDLSIEIAEHFNTEIISADSRQLYKELRIGTAVPTNEQLGRVQHHFIQCLSICDYYNASMFEGQVIDTLNELFKKKATVVMAGGSGLYVNAVCEGIDELPTIEPDVRETLINRFETEGIESLRMQLKKCDPGYYANVDLRNPKRIMKALEVFIMTGKPYSTFLTKSTQVRAFEVIKIGLARDRGELYERINQRVDNMLKDGLVEEARLFFPGKKLNALNTVGYKELFHYFDGKISLNEAVGLIKRNTRRYAKSQITWFNRDKQITWFHPDNLNGIIDFIEDKQKLN